MLMNHSEAFTVYNPSTYKQTGKIEFQITLNGTSKGHCINRLRDMLNKRELSHLNFIVESDVTTKVAE